MQNLEQAATLSTIWGGGGGGTWRGFHFLECPQPILKKYAFQYPVSEFLDY